MPRRAPTVCAHPSCRALVYGTARCAEHKLNNPQPFQHLYQTPAWRNARFIYLKHHRTCVECGQPATTVDHIQAHRGDPTLFWRIENWQALCTSCHSRKTALEDGGFGHTAMAPTPPSLVNAPTPASKAHK